MLSGDKMSLFLQRGKTLKNRYNLSKLIEVMNEGKILICDDDELRNLIVGTLGYPQCYRDKKEIEIADSNDFLKKGE